MPEVLCEREGLVGVWNTVAVWNSVGHWNAMAWNPGAVWNTVMDEDCYLTGKWNEFTSA
jgi:hypothetical protein